MKRIVIGMLLLSMTACASSRGFDRGRLRSEITDQKMISDADIEKALALKPQLPYPYNLAIYFAPPASNRYYANPGTGAGTTRISSSIWPTR